MEGDANVVHYEVGRAKGFFSHRPPGCIVGQTDGVIHFVEAKWLAVAEPSFTERSNLFIVVLDKTDDHYRGDDSAGDGLIDRCWPVLGLELRPLGLVPLDSKHDVCVW